MEKEGTIPMDADRTASGGMERAEAALLSMEALRIAVATKIEEINGMSLEDLAIKDVRGLLRELGNAVSNGIAEERKVADALRIERGGDGIDLDAARVEIESRLARIGEALGQGRVS